MKVACPAVSGGKGGDNFKTLPIAIVPVFKNEKCVRNQCNGFTKVIRYAYEVQIYG